MCGETLSQRVPKGTRHIDASHKDWGDAVVDAWFVAHTLGPLWICLKDTVWDIPFIICSKLVLEIKSPVALSMNREELLKI